MAYSPTQCITWWGSHGCDIPVGHVEAGNPVHRCGNPDDPDDGGCSEAILWPGIEMDSDSSNGAVRYYMADGTISEWYPALLYR